MRASNWPSPVVTARRRLGRRVAEWLKKLDEHSLAELFLRRKVIEQARLRDPDLLGDALNGHAGEALSREQARSGFEDSCFGCPCGRVSTTW